MADSSLISRAFDHVGAIASPSGDALTEPVWRAASSTAGMEGESLRGELLASLNGGSGGIGGGANEVRQALQAAGGPRPRRA